MNRATRITVTTLGIIFAIGGMSHGFFETLQGSTPTGGLFIEAIGESHRMWVHGAEAAFTLIPNFLVTGIAAITVSLAIIVWSAGFLHRKHGATVFLLLFILLFLVGGGIGQVVFFTIAWAFATRINQPLTGWRKVLPEGLRKALARVWPWTTAAGTLLIFTALEIAIFGYFPGVNDTDQLLQIMLTTLGLGLVLFLLSFVAGIAYDIQKQGAARLSPAISG